MATYDSNVYCDFADASAKAGKDILLCIFNADGSELLAISGQQSLSINRSADTIDISSKDTEGGWKKQLAGAKSWDISNDGIYIIGSESHKLLGQYFESGALVCLKIVDAKETKPLMGGLACITDYSLDAPYDDAMTYSLSLAGSGRLVDLTDLSEEDAANVTAMPE
ncbi:MAG: phage major tail protein, TP901-1 family [Ruminococcus sp.]|nr:phage major tail protein, TP901-1 family [Ruminococcus sp.]